MCKLQMAPRAIIKHLLSYCGWLFALNAAAGVFGWIPMLTGMAPTTYLLTVFIITLPVALWCEIRMGDLEK